MTERTQTDCKKIDVIAFDADDTLWDNEPLFVTTKDKFLRLMSHYHNDPEWIAQKLDETEVHNLQYFGYGIKSFTISMLETALELTDGQIQVKDIREIVAFAKEMVSTPVQLFDHVKEVVHALSASYKLMVITKGDLFDQERKISQSGLAQYFTYTEVLSEKTPKTYTLILEKYQIDPQQFLMVGNSLRSDILPVIAIGGHAVLIPYHLTWGHENVIDHYEEQDGYVECDHIGLLSDLIERLNHDSHRGIETERNRR